MKRFTLVLLVALQALAQSNDSSVAALSGVVTSKDGRPLAGAKVTLTSPPISTEGARPASVGKSAVADERGRYTVEGVSPGTYFLVADATGYVKQPYGGKPGYFGTYDGRALPLSATPVLVSGNTSVSSLNIQLTRQGAISGRVTSAGGDPAGTIPVFAVRWTYLDGARKLLEKGRATTDNQGAFRIDGLAPGQYFVYAVPPADPGSRPTQPKRSRLPTYSPNALRVPEATAVNLGLGSDGFADVRLREDAQVTVRGNVVGSQGNRPPAGATVLLMQDPDTPVAGGIAGAQDSGPRPFTPTYRTLASAGPNGEFEMEGVMPGTHRLLAFGGNNPTLNMSAEGTRRSVGGSAPPGPDEGSSGAVDLSVGNQNLDRVTILLRPGGEITSKITMDGMSYQEWAGQRIERTKMPAEQKAKMLERLPLPDVALIPEAGVAVGGIFRGRADGRSGFTQKVTVGRYFMEVTGTNRDFYVKSLRLGNQDVTRQPFDFKGGIVEMEIILGVDFGRVTGSVTNRNGDPVPGAPMSLWPAKRDYTRRDGGVLTGTSRQDGSFIFPLVPPGDYTVIPFEELPDPGLAEYPDFVGQFLARGKRVKVDPNQAARTTVETVAAAEIQRVLATLR